MLWLALYRVSYFTCRMFLNMQGLNGFHNNLLFTPRRPCSTNMTITVPLAHVPKRSVLHVFCLNGSVAVVALTLSSVLKVGTPALIIIAKIVSQFQGISSETTGYQP